MVRACTACCYTRDGYRDEAFRDIRKKCSIFAVLSRIISGWCESKKYPAMQKILPKGFFYCCGILCHGFRFHLWSLLRQLRLCRLEAGAVVLVWVMLPSSGRRTIASGESEEVMVVQCCLCRQVRKGKQWEEPVQGDLAGAVSHGYCPVCAAKAFAEIQDLIGAKRLSQQAAVG